MYVADAVHDEKTECEQDALAQFFGLAKGAPACVCAPFALLLMPLVRAYLLC